MRIRHEKYNFNHWGFFKNLKDKVIIIDLGRHAFVVNW